MSKPRRLSAHFKAREIFGDHSPTPLQFHLARRLCIDLLEQIRATVESPLFITDGHRTKEQTAALEARGLHPSKTSDHSYGDQWNPYGVGAADLFKIETDDEDRRQYVPFTEADYHHINSVLGGNIVTGPPWGQLIWYRNRGHIHVANPRSVLFSAQAIEALPMRQYRSWTYINEV